MGSVFLTASKVITPPDPVRRNNLDTSAGKVARMSWSEQTAAELDALLPAVLARAFAGEL
jgi:hypothetical protein